MLKDAVDLSTLHRVLVVKLRHLGDVLLTSPVFTVLKNHVPHAEIDALVYRDTEPMLSGHPAIANIFTPLYQVPSKPRHTVETHLDALRRLGIYPEADERQLVLDVSDEAETS